MKVYATYCSAEKVNTQHPVAAIELYKSQRIDHILWLAKQDDHQFVILSGKYGIVDTEEKIPYYDHLLTSHEVINHSSLVANQIKKKGITEVQFYVGDINRDKNILTYIECISFAALKANITLEVKVYQSI
jgi:hypothetical protein